MTANAKNAVPELPEVGDLTLPEKIGQMLCLGWGGADSLYALNPQAHVAIEEIGAGSIILFGRNVQPEGKEAGGSPPTIDVSAIRTMVGEAQSLAKIPLLVGVDQEGGRVARLGASPFTRMPSARQTGRRADADLARRAAWATARELSAVGINWNFAPDADVDSNPANPVIADRAFSHDAIVAAEFVAAQVAGYAEGGVLSCVKHFPGHGDTSVDSHFALPTLPFTLGAMRERELVPFHAAIGADVPTIMTAHITFPALDPSGLPATLSRPVLTDLLRETLGFRGLVVTDSLEMRAVADGWGVGRAAVLSAIAGADMLMVCHTLADQREAHSALLDAADSGELSIARIDEAVGRVLTAKRRALALPQAPLDVIGCAEHRVIRDAIIVGGDAVTSERTTMGD